ncbi:MAG: aminopeptidase [Pseudobdellovibrionaceae bacterium]
MDLLIKALGFAILCVSISGCQMGYYFSSAYNQMSLLNQRVPIEKALQDPTLSEKEKKALQLAQRARQFAEGELHLKSTKNYTSYVKLDRPYVTYVVSASPKWELSHYDWHYLFVGKMPYKGFFNEDDAKEEAEELKKKDLDVYVRGVSAYSTLGWFNDPLLSSMVKYEDHELVNTVIHETVHATLYIKGSADFNERLAVFLGNKGMELFYLKEEGPSSPSLKLALLENEDEKLFSKFISREITDLEEWYKNQNEKNEEIRKARLKEIQARFTKEIEPHLKSDNYQKFSSMDLNNARLLLYKTYLQDLSDFEKLYEMSDRKFDTFLQKCRSLENSKNPEEDLKKLISN